nr:uncharacterized protein LOC126528975 isoform X5 [Dermacentor andersoni]
MGRPRIVRTEEEQRVHLQRRREKQRECARRRRAAARAARASVDELDPLRARLARQERRRAQNRECQRRRRDAAKARRSDPRPGDDPLRARDERAREQHRERERRRRQSSTGEKRAAEAARKRQARDDPEYREAGNAKRRRCYNPPQLFPGVSARFELGEALPAADGVKARRTRVHRTERRWPLVTCPHHSTSAAGTLRVATADFSAVFPDIDFKQAVETACDKAPFIEASLAGTTCQVEPWRGLQDKCVGECEALLQHAEQSCQTEHHITLVRCTKPQVSTCSVEVQADPWWQHHCGIQPIGVDLCET